MDRPLAPALQPPPAGDHVSHHVLPDGLAALLRARQTVLPKRLGAPGPDAAQLQSILAAADHAHGFQHEFLRISSSRITHLSFLLA